MRACVRACVRATVRARVRACVRACVRVRVCVCVCVYVCEASRLSYKIMHVHSARCTEMLSKLETKATRRTKGED